MTEETRPGFLANYKIVRPGPARPAFGPARLTPLVYTVILPAGNIKYICNLYVTDYEIYCNTQIHDIFKIQNKYTNKINS